MSFLDRVCVLILTFDEEPNIARTLEALSAFPRVLILDSGSTDATRTIAAGYANVRIAIRAFDAHATQWNHGLAACGVAEPWILALDADFRLDPALVAEIAALSPPDHVSGYRAGFRYCIGGHPLSGTLYPDQTVLFRRDRGRYVQAGHAQRLVLDGGETRALAARIDHDDRKPLGRWMDSQRRYAALEADFLMSAPSPGLSGRIRRLGWAAPLLVFIYTLVVKRCCLDGWPGWIYVLQRTLAEIMIALEILDRRRASRPTGARP